MRAPRAGSDNGRGAIRASGTYRSDAFVALVPRDASPCALLWTRPREGDYVRSMADATVSFAAIRQVRARVEVSLSAAREALERAGGDVEAAVRSLMTPEQREREMHEAYIERARAGVRGSPAAAPVASGCPGPPGPERLRDWIATRIEASAPDPNATVAGFGVIVQDLASALAALERGAGTVFGLHAGPEVLALARPLAPRARALLEAWVARLEAVEGLPGADAVRQIAARCDVRIEQAPGASSDPDAWPLPEPSRVALARLAQTLDMRDACAAYWRVSGALLEEDDVVAVRTGRVDRARLRAGCDLVVARGEAPLPRFYVRLLTRYNGLAIESAPADEVVSGEVAAEALGEPVIWPFDTYGDHALLSTCGLPGIDAPFVFGGIGDVGHLVFDGRPGPASPEDAPVYWVPQRFASEPPVHLADTLGAFVERLCAHWLCLPLLLREARAPGWG